MSERSVYKRKAQFHVMFRLKRADLHDQWRDFFGKAMTYVAACEEVERLTSQEGLEYEFKVLHQKLIGKAA